MLALNLNQYIGIVPLCFVVPNFSRLRRFSIRWNSKPFYSHAHGYGLSLIVSPNGCGSARGAYVSVFICLMKGEFDDELKWPIHASIGIQLVNHYNGHNRCYHRINLMERGRVIVGEKDETTWGNHKFISHDVLYPEFLLNDCLYIPQYR